MYKIISLIFIFSMFISLVSAEEIPQYDIEIILFEHKNDTDINSEIWPLSPEMPVTENTLNIDAEQNQSKVRKLKPDNYHLSDQMEKLVRSENYSPLLHVAWRQNVFAPEDALPVHISTDNLKMENNTESTEQEQPAPANAIIDGNITVSLKRYLHMKADLAYIPNNQDGLFSPEGTPLVFRMNESRKMRSKEVHYFDHPKFGMIAIITPYEPPPQPKPLPVAPETQAPHTSTN